MREIGGYIELDTYTLPMLHESAIALNCGRNALAYLIQAKNIKKIQIPKFLCASVSSICKRENVEIAYYSITKDFEPKDITLESDQYLYVVNYYGQISNDKIRVLKEKYKNIIIDNVQAYYQMPVEGVDTLYTCRKFFGVSDGAFLYTDKVIGKELELDESYDRMHFLLGRFERTASEFYLEYVENNDVFDNEPPKKMSKLTDNLLHAIDYERVKQIRTQNFEYLHKNLEKINMLNLKVPSGAFMYPLYIKDGYEIRKMLQKEKIYIPTLWPDVFDICEDTELEYDMAKNILPLPVDQRYGEIELKRMIEFIYKREGA